PHAPFPYSQLLDENRHRGKDQPEFELLDTGVFDEDRYFDIFVEYAKGDAEDIFIKISVSNRGPETARLRVLPTIWFRANAGSIARALPNCCLRITKPISSGYSEWETAPNV